MKKILAVILTFGVHLTTNAAAKDLLVLIDSLCVGSQGKADVVEKMVLAQGGKRLPQSFVDADPVGAKNGGRAFSLKFNSERYFIMCLDSWDHIPMRSWPLFKARQVLRTLFQSDLSLVA